MALAELHRSLDPEAHLTARFSSAWSREQLERVVVGAGFETESIEANGEDEQLIVTATRRWSLPDCVGADMRLLMCGLNPSPSSADSGVGFFRAGNRFWPAALAAGLVSRDRDPHHALAEHGIGMTDLVKRTTRRADELDNAEYREGLDRVHALIEWLKPSAVCFVGLAGYRAGVDRKAVAGWQSEVSAAAPCI